VCPVGAVQVRSALPVWVSCQVLWCLSLCCEHERGRWVRLADGGPADHGAVREMEVVLALRSLPAGGGFKPPCAAAVNGGSW
jgi:hypothetical protein